MMKSIICLELFTRCIFGGNEYLDQRDELQQPKPIIEYQEELTLEATYYTAFCPTGCIGITKTGHDVKNRISVDGKRVVAVDPKIIPLYSELEITMPDGQKIEAIALDTGGDIKGNRIDILVKTRAEAYKLGRHDVKVKITKKGEKK